MVYGFSLRVSGVFRFIPDCFIIGRCGGCVFFFFFLIVGMDLVLPDVFCA